MLIRLYKFIHPRWGSNFLSNPSGDRKSIVFSSKTPMGMVSEFNFFNSISNENKTLGQILGGVKILRYFFHRDHFLAHFSNGAWGPPGLWHSYFYFLQISDQGGGLNFSSEADRLLLGQMAIKIADISGPSKEWDLHYRWTERIIEEFYQQVWIHYFHISMSKLAYTSLYLAHPQAIYWSLCWSITFCEFEFSLNWRHSLIYTAMT